MTTVTLGGGTGTDWTRDLGNVFQNLICKLSLKLIKTINTGLHSFRNEIKQADSDRMVTIEILTDTKSLE